MARHTESLSLSEISRNYFRLPAHFQKALWGHPGPLQYQVPPSKATSQQKMGPDPSTLIQIYKQWVRPIFEYGSLSTITISDFIISKIQLLQNKFIRFALRLLKYICSKLLHDSSSLPYVKDRLVSCVSKSLDTRGVDIFQQAQSCLRPFANAIISGPSCKSLV